jgi:hypothetical protein
MLLLLSSQIEYVLWSSCLDTYWRQIKNMLKTNQKHVEDKSKACWRQIKNMLKTNQKIVALI